MGKVIDIIKKHGITALGTFIAVDGYRRAVFSHHKELQNLKAENAEQIDEIRKKILDLSIKNDTFKNSLDLKSKAVSELEKGINTLHEKIESFQTQLATGKYNAGYTKDILTSDIARFNGDLKDLTVVRDKEVHELVDLIGKGTNKSSILGDLNVYLDWYKDMVSSLAPDQLVALVNIFGFFLLLSTLYSMGIIYIGNNFIDKWEVEKRYPKLSKYIQYKTKVNEYSMKFYFISLFIVVLIWFCLNIYMFLFRFLM